MLRVSNILMKIDKNLLLVINYDERTIFSVWITIFTYWEKKNQKSMVISYDFRYKQKEQKLQKKNLENKTFIFDISKPDSWLLRLPATNDWKLCCFCKNGISKNKKASTQTRSFGKGSHYSKAKYHRRSQTNSPNWFPYLYHRTSWENTISHQTRTELERKVV